MPKDPNERVGVSNASSSVVAINVCWSVEVNECRGKRVVTLAAMPQRKKKGTLW